MPRSEIHRSVLSEETFGSELCNVLSWWEGQLACFSGEERDSSIRYMTHFNNGHPLRVGVEKKKIPHRF